MVLDGWFLKENKLPHWYIEEWYYSLCTCFLFFFFLVVLPHFVLCVLLGSYVALFMGLSFQKVASSQSIQSGISIGRKHTEKIKLDTEFCHVNWANTCLDFGHYLISDAIVPLWTWVSEFRHYCPILDRSFFFHPCIYPFFPLFRLYKNLPEVKAKNEQQKRLAFYRTNRLRAQLYDKVSLFVC